MTDPRPVAVIVLAAGEGTRMRSALPKVLHPVCGRAMVGHVVAAAQALEPEHLVVVVGHGREAVTAHLAELAPSAVPVVQAEQNGTGHAVRLALEAVSQRSGTVVVVPGDAPLITAASLADLVRHHEATGSATTLLTADLADPTGYGRVVRAAAGDLARVVEHRDASPAELSVSEVATSVYAFSLPDLRTALDSIGSANAAGEEYLTDVIGVQVDGGLPVAALRATEATDTMGVNDRVQLAEAQDLLRSRILRSWMLAGVTVSDPLSTWVGVDVVLAADVTLHPNTRLEGSTVVRADAVIGPDTTLIDSEVGERSRVLKSHCDGAVIGPDVAVGPYTYLRPGTRLGPGSKAGAYVEMKAAHLGEGSKVPHLAYVGDAVIGAGSNIGAGTIVVNYDGQAKHRTTVGDNVRVGSNNSLVAPVTVHDGAYTAAGSAITEDVPAGAIGVARARQRNIEGWVARRRQGPAQTAPPATTEEGP